MVTPVAGGSESDVGCLPRGLLYEWTFGVVGVIDHLVFAGKEAESVTTSSSGPTR
jgi:hypothetical protein